MAKTVELRRHTANDGDVLTIDGVRSAVDIGLGMRGPLDLVVTSGMQRATQAAACMLAGGGHRAPRGVIVDDGFRSQSEQRWREIYATTGATSLEDFWTQDPTFVEKEAARLGDALRRTFDALPEGGRALVVGHGPTQEVAVWALTRVFVPALKKGEGVLVIEEDGVLRVEEP